MADKKITQLTNITGANLVDADEFVVVDISADETKAITLGELKEAFDSGSGFVRITGDTMTGDLALSGADVTFGDNDKAIFGAGSDLQIYHNGTDSLIADTGSGTLKIYGDTEVAIQDPTNGEYMAKFIKDGAVELYHNNALTLATTATGIDATGTLSANGLIIENGGSATNSLDITYSGSSGQANIQVDSNGGSTFLTFGTSQSGTVAERMRIDASGNVGIGTTPSAWNSLMNATQIGTAASFWGSTNTSVAAMTANAYYNSAGNYIYINTDEASQYIQVDGTHSWLNAPSGSAGTTATLTERMRIDSSGNVGIGTSSPAGSYGKNLQVHTAATSGSSLHLTDGTTGSGVNDGLQIICTNGLSYIWNRETTDMVFATSNLERMRIDSSGSWMTGNTVARTASQYSNQGGASWYHPDQHFEISTTSNAPALEVGKNNANDGSLIAFRKQGAIVGSIGTAGGNLIVEGNTATGKTGIKFGGAEWIPQDNGNSDGGVDLGISSARFKDLYLSGGVYLGGTGAANKLDDYEEGTFTPTIEAYAGTDPTPGYGTRIGNYVKIGSLVHIEINIDLSSMSGGAGNLLMISGLPFTIGNGDCVGSLNTNDVNFARTGGYNAPVQKLLPAALGFLTCTNGGGWAWEYTNILGASSAIRITMTYST